MPSFRALASGLSVFSSASCANSAPSLSGPPLGTINQSIIDQLIGRVPNAAEPEKESQIENHTLFPPVANDPKNATNSVPAPACKQQGPFMLNGETSQYPHATPSK